MFKESWLQTDRQKVRQIKRQIVGWTLAFLELRLQLKSFADIFHVDIHIRIHNCDFLLDVLLIFVGLLWSCSISWLIGLFWFSCSFLRCRIRVSSWLVNSSFLFCKLELIWLMEVNTNFSSEDDWNKYFHKASSLKLYI